MLFYIHVVQFGNDPTRLELLESQIYVINRQCRYISFQKMVFYDFLCIYIYENSKHTISVLSNYRIL